MYVFDKKSRPTYNDSRRQALTTLLMKTFAELFRRYRLRAEFSSLSEFADAFATKGYFYDLSIFCHWQKGKRIPSKRVVLITMLEIFIENKAISSLEKANELLESAGHGYLTKNEQQRFQQQLSTSEHATIVM